MLVIKARIHKMHVRLANREDSGQTASQKQSALSLRCLSRLLDSLLVFEILEHLPYIPN